MRKGCGDHVALPPPQQCGGSSHPTPVEEAMSLNKVMLIGRLGDKPKIEECSAGLTRVGLSVVTAMETIIDVDTGEQREGQEWHRIVVVEPGLAAYAKAHLDRDDKVYVEGQLQTSCWRDQTFQWSTLTHVLLAKTGDQLTRLEAGDGVLRAYPPAEQLGCPA